MIESHQVKVERTAHYYTIGQASPKVKYLILACHGYGQLAQFFIRKFDVLAREDTLIVAPEGLSRFYWQSGAGKVVASWMTKEDRLSEIADYARYLEQLHQHYLSLLNPDVKTILFGFSQGCATVVRWPMTHFPTFDTLVLWGGMIPEDLDYKPYTDYWSEKKIHVVYGSEDRFITAERIAFHQQLLAEQQLVAEETVFNGAHIVDREALVQLFDKIRQAD